MKSKDISSVVKDVFINEAKNRGFLSYQFLQKWNEIVEPSLLNKIFPIKIVKIKAKNVLYIFSQDYDVIYNFQYKKKAILEKINLFFSDLKIEDIMIKHD